MKFAYRGGLLDNKESLPMSQWSGELYYGIHHEHNIGVMVYHAEPWSWSLSPFNIDPTVDSSDEQNFYFYTQGPDFCAPPERPSYVVFIPKIIIIQNYIHMILLNLP